MHDLGDDAYGKLCDLLAGATGTIELLLKEPLTEKQCGELNRTLKALMRMRKLLNGSIEKKAFQ